MVRRTADMHAVIAGLQPPSMGYWVAPFERFQWNSNIDRDRCASLYPDPLKSFEKFGLALGFDSGEAHISLHDLIGGDRP